MKGMKIVNTISKQIIETLSKNGIKEEDYLNSLENIYNDIKFSLWKEIVISPDILNFIRSLCFYNFEHKINCPGCGNFNIQYYGSKYNILMFEIQNCYVDRNKIESFIMEIESILNNLKEDKDIKAANLFAEFDFDWKIDGKNSTQMIVYDEKENPQKYGYHASGKNYTGIYGKDGKQIVIEQEIVDNYCTEAFIEKEYSKILNETGEWDNRKIPMLLGRVFSELVKEETWNIIKKYKNPTINYKTLNALVINKIKVVKSDIF